MQPLTARTKVRLQHFRRITTGTDPVEAPVGTKRVYIVDDDATIVRSTSFLLGLNAIEARGFASGEELLEALHELAPGCILLDLMLPQRSGLEVQDELARRGSRMPVIAMTGGADREAAAQALTLGALTLIEKPFAEETLLAALRRGFDLLDEDEGPPPPSGKAKRARPSKR